MIDYSGVDEVIEEVRRLGGVERIAEANARMGEGVRVWLMEWYLERAESGHFENPGLPTHGAGRNKTGWANEVARGWMAETRGDGARVYLSGQGGGEMGGDLAGSLLLKIYGGCVEAKSAGALTIPLVPEAHGRRASVYESVMGRRLFVVGQRESGADGAFLCEGDGHGGVRAVYKLKRSQVFEPWPESFPDEEVLAEAAFRHFMGGLMDDGSEDGVDWVD